MELDWEIYDASLAVRGGAWLGEIAGLEGLGGVSLRQVNLEARAGDLTDRDEAFSGGPMAGVQLSVRPLGFLPDWRWLTLYGRGTIDHVFAGEGGEQGLRAGELGIEVQPYRRLGAYAGWRWWHLRRDRGFDDSEVTLDIQGPAIGILVAF